MSLTAYIQRADVAAMLKPFRPKSPRRLSATVKVAPRTKHYTMVGTAFDYLLRFELQRRVPGAVVRPWVAEAAPLEMYRVPRRLRPDDLRNSEDFDPEDAAARAENIIKEAREALDAYLRVKDPTASEQVRVAFYALLLAKLDEVYRIKYLDPRFDDPDIVTDDDFDDLIGMLDIVPFETLLRSGPLLLNPAFGDASKRIGGADADLVSGNMLIDIKVTAKSCVEADQLDQLLGYFLLSREHRKAEPAFPEIEHAGIYFARQGQLWSMPVSCWTAHANFAALEKAFVEGARIGP